MRHIVLKSMRVGWTFGFGNAHNCNQKIWGVAIAKSQWRGKNATFYCNRSLASSSTKNLFPQEIGSYLHWPRVGHHRPIQNKVICVDIVMAKPKLVLHIVGRTELFLRPFVTWIVNVMFASVTLWYAQNPCIGLHCPLPFGRGGGNIAMCHLEGKQPTFNTNVVYATPCFIQLNDFCMCRGIAWGGKW